VKRMKGTMLDGKRIFNERDPKEPFISRRIRREHNNKSMSSNIELAQKIHALRSDGIRGLRKNSQVANAVVSKRHTGKNF